MPKRSSVRAALLVVCLLAAPAAFAENVRAISDAERTAVQAAAGYLSRGPEAIHEQLATTSPFAKLPREEALKEIEVRLGPAAGAEWELQTVVPALQDDTAVFNISYASGADETVVFKLVKENGAHRIEKLRTLAEPSAIAPIFPPEKAAVAAEATPKGPSRLPLAAGIIGVLLAIGSPFAMRSNAAAARAMLAVAVVVLAGGIYLGTKSDARFMLRHDLASINQKETIAFPSLGALLPLRRAIAEGTGGVDAAYRQVPLKGLPHDVATLWKAQSDLQQMKTDDVARALRAFPSPSSTPLAEILRGRLAFFQAREVDAVLAYERAVNLGPGRDGLWFETASALETLGFADRAEGYLRRLSRMGSRDASVYYSLAMLAAVHSRDDDAENALYKAWNLKPLERKNLFGAAALWAVLRKPRITGVIKLNSAAEATFASGATSTRPIALPANSKASISGDYLFVAIGQQELSVPGGACLAPAGTPTVDAAAWRRAEEQKGLEEFQQLVALARNAGAFTQPLLRRRIERCAAALSNHNRWADLVQLTDGVSAKSESVPTDLLFLRNVALQRTQRVVEAKALLAELARSPVLQRRNDPQTYMELGAMLASLDLFDAAIKVMDRAAAARSSATIDDEVAKIQMNRQLATKYQTFNSGHFIIHYPDDVAPASALTLGKVLESELKRLQKWVPTPNFRPVVVNVVWWRDFRSTYTGSDFILGFYEGKITVPLAGVPDFYPEIVAILTHELCHAMIAQATGDSAPHWFQEGLAQRVEMVEYQRNAFNMYDDDRLLSISLLDAVLRGSPDPEMIGEAYIVAQTIIRYIEATYGPAGITKMLAAYRDGSTTEEAIEKLSGMSVADFDTKLRAWGRGGTKVFENHEIVYYMRTGSDAIHWTRRNQQQTPGGH